MSSLLPSRVSGAAGQPLRLPLLRVWADPVPRRGYENMAADELLLLSGDAWLRLYGWAEPAVSFGYFDTQSVARRIFPGAKEYIRRWTGGGIVDHRHGVTYTLTLPAPPEESPPHPPASRLYEWIHGALAHALRQSGVECSLLLSDAPDGGRACWASPVASDIVDPAGRKLAGAGQRRFRGAVLHQGLIQQCSPLPGWERILAAELSQAPVFLSSPAPWPGFEADLAALCRAKYCSPDWEDETHGRRRPTRS